jgi:hypothetical protein
VNQEKMKLFNVKVSIGMKQKTNFMVNLLKKTNQSRSGFILSVLFIVAFLLGSVQGWGQSIFTNSITGSNPNSSNPYTDGQIIASGITVSGIGRGSGITGVNSNDRYNANGWNSASFDANDYFEWTITPEACKEIDFESFVYSSSRSGNNSNQWVDGFALRSSLDGYSSNIGTATSGSSIIIQLNISNYQNINTAITFRLYGWGADAATRTFSIDNFTFNGVVNSISPTGVTASVSSSAICSGSSVNLISSATSNSNTATTLLNENFNGSATGWTSTNSSTGGTPANAAWTLRANGFNDGNESFNSNDATQFYLSNSDNQGSGGTTATTLQSPSFSTIGLSSASLTFFQYYRYNATETAVVQVSTDGSNWTNLNTAPIATIGTRNNFVSTNLSLNSYLGQSTVSIRFKYDASFDWYWAIDNVSVTGTYTTSPAATFAWTSSLAGFTSSTQNPTGVSPTATTTYTVTATNSYGCTASASTTVTVNPLPNATFTGVSNYGTLCQGQNYTLTPVTAGGSWSVSNATFLNVNNGIASILPNTTPNGAQSNIVYSVTANGCTNTSTVSNLFLQPTPSAPTITAQSLCSGATHTVSSLPSGTGYTWYGSADATVAFTSNLILGNTYYVSQTLNGCTSARTPVSTISTGETYGTRASGYWDGSSTWERYCYSGNSYSMTPVSSSTPPASDYAGEIVIKNGHTIQIGSSVSTESIDKVISAELEIKSGGKLHILSNGSLRTSENIVNAGEFRIKSGGQLVQESNVDPSGNGNYIFEKDLPAIANSNLANYNRSYYIGSPVVGSANSPLSISSVLGASTAALTMYSYNESTNAWPLHYNGAQQNNVGSTFEIGKGYFVNSSPALVPGATYFGQAVFTGKSFNNGDITVPLTFGAGNGYNLISNPYPSSIKWTQILPANSNAATTYWVRTYEDGMGMVYKNFVTNGANSGVGTDETVTDYIAPGQAFWVKINNNNANATSFTFTNSMRTHIPGVAHTGEANRVVRLNLTNALGHKDRAVVYMNEDAALTYDSYDSDKRIPSTTVHQLYSLEGTTKLAINGFNNALAKDTVLLGMQIPTAGTYTINASQIDATIEEDVFLEDKITGAYQNLKTTPSYTFTSTQGTFNNRFVLHFAPYVPALPGQTAATAIAMPTSNWPQCNNVTTEDQWHAFTATSEGISIEVNTASTDIVIELQDGTGNVVAQENAVNGIGNETLNFFGLTAGQTYKVGVRNNISSQPTGTYGICVKSLKRGGCDYGAGPYSLCQYYKATWAGSTGVSYTFTFTGTSGPAEGQTFTRTQNSDICVLSTVTPLLPYGSTYDVVISNTYTLTDGAGNTEQITVPSINGCQVITIAEPQTALSNSSSCNNGARFRGAVVSSMPWVCGSNNWRWRFTEVNPLTMQTVGLPIELNRGSASNYLSLGTVSQLQNGKTYAVQTAPIFNYTGTNYNWGPVQYMCIVGAANVTQDATQDAMQDPSEDASQEAAQGSNKLLTQDVSQVEAMVYVTEGNVVNIQLTNTASNTAKRADIYDVTGKLVKSVRLVEGMNEVTLTETTGIYMVRTVVGNQSETTRVFVNN